MKSKHFLWNVLWTSLVVCSVSGGPPDTLRMLQVVFRHGDRSPIRTFPTDPNQEDSWPQGWGQLTQIGMQQGYSLGKHLRNTYGGFINDTYIKNEIYAESTNYDRTLMTTEAVLAGLYHPVVQGQQWNQDGIDWLPIPIQTKPKYTDRVLYMNPPCPAYDEAEKQTYLSEPVISYIEQNKDFLDYIYEASGLNTIKDPATLQDIMSYIPEPLLCEKIHNKAWPSWVNESIYEKTQEILLVKAKAWYPTPEMQRLKGGRWLHEVTQKIVNYTENPESMRKVYLQGSHDSSIIAFLTAMGAWDEMFPSYAISIMLELHDAQAGQYEVRLLQKNDTESNTYPQNYTEAVQLEIKDCPSPCLLEDFRKVLGPMMVSSDEELDDLCKLPKDESIHYGTLIGLMIGTLVILILIVAAGVLYHRSKNSSNSYNCL